MTKNKTLLESLALLEQAEQSKRREPYQTKKQCRQILENLAGHDQNDPLVRELHTRASQLLGN